jgi:hypothetical protein
VPPEREERGREREEVGQGEVEGERDEGNAVRVRERCEQMRERNV